MIQNISTILKTCYNIDWKDKIFLECGAGPHGNETHEFNFENCYYMEPVKEYFDILYSLKPDKTKLFNLGLSNLNSDDVNFTQTSHLGNGSIKHSKDHIEELKSYNSSFIHVKIKTITYETFLNLIDKNIDILLLDVEGHEVEILKTFFELDEKQKPIIIVIECGYDWKERLSILKKLGYNLDFYYYNNAYLSLITSNILKNIQPINTIKKQWSSWSYNGKVIYNDTDI